MLSSLTQLRLDHDESNTRINVESLDSPVRLPVLDCRASTVHVIHSRRPVCKPRESGVAVSPSREINANNVPYARLLELLKVKCKRKSRVTLIFELNKKDPEAILDSTNLDKQSLRQVSLSAPISQILDLIQGPTHGCQQLQNIITESSQEDASSLAAAISPHIATLICHQSGIFVIQRICTGVPTFLDDVTLYCQTNLIDLSNNESGTRILQFLIEVLSNFRK